MTKLDGDSHHHNPNVIEYVPGGEGDEYPTHVRPVEATHMLLTRSDIKGVQRLALRDIAAENDDPDHHYSINRRIVRLGLDEN